jgi:hypothetical protein
LISDEDLAERLDPATSKLEYTDRRARQLAKDRLLDRAIDVEAAATEIEQLMRLARDGAAATS